MSPAIRSIRYCRHYYISLALNQWVFEAHRHRSREFFDRMFHLIEERPEPQPEGVEPIDWPGAFFTWFSDICDDVDASLRIEDELASRGITYRVRWEVFLRDNFRCQWCGSRRDLALDHIHPRSKGGENVMTNFQTLCRSCNSRKGARVGVNGLD